MDNIYKKNINLNGLTKQQQKLCKYIAPSRRSGQLPWGFWRRVRDIIFWHTAAYVFSSGKDLARVSMPAPLNEPLNLLQRLCEELEYSELLDRAANTQDPFERMVRWTIHCLSVWGNSLLLRSIFPNGPALFLNTKVFVRMTEDSLNREIISFFFWLVHL